MDDETTPEERSMASRGRRNSPSSVRRREPQGETRKTVIDDREMYIPMLSRVCTFCRRWRPEKGRICPAFPQGIPMVIWLGEHDHQTSYPGDGGLQFLPFGDEHRS